MFVYYIYLNLDFKQICSTLFSFSVLKYNWIFWNLQYCVNIYLPLWCFKWCYETQKQDFLKYLYVDCFC